ncbi:MAG: GyrI-like domain-containing protein [Bacteroidetes bacterium]|nr:GyrI-like domain-containing protein [Bacteroidota bacterium]
MEPRIELLAEKKLLGMRLTMSIAQNKTGLLWQGFMKRRKEIQNNLNSDLISMQVYSPFFDFINFNVEAEFDKWATTEVSDFKAIPEGMESFVLVGGLYAVFFYKGDASPAAAAKVFSYIYGQWIPNSIYELDQRPHFEILGEKYKKDAPDSEEEIWIPIKHKN